mmetsp:Transcript_89422/g.255357  ORF Transcript_89422/g.255357 Transcript_89422/m.255357 type:complete len:186 (-) Transcript_89422:144-701(-)
MASSMKSSKNASKSTLGGSTKTDGDDIRSSVTGRAATMPLLDAVQGLVEKERALMQLRLSEAADETNAWRAKYESLAGVDGQGVPGQHKAQGPAPHLLSHWELVTHPPTAPISAAMRAMGSLDLSFESLGLDEMDLITRQLKRVGPPKGTKGAPGIRLNLSNNMIDDMCSRQLSKILMVGSGVLV